MDRNTSLSKDLQSLRNATVAVELIHNETNQAEVCSYGIALLMSKCIYAYYNILWLLFFVF